VSQSLSRSQALVLGFVVVLVLALGGYGVARIADKQGFWTETTELTAGFAEAHDVTPGTPVRVRGVEAGQVLAVEYPDHDGPGAQVTVRMRVHTKFATRLYANARAHIHANGLLGAKVIAIQPGDPSAGALAGTHLAGVKPFEVADAVNDVRDLAKEAKALATDTRAAVASAKEVIDGVRAGEGSLGKLVRDDSFYDEARKVLARADKAITNVDGEMGALRGFVSDGRDTLRSVKQGTDAIGKMPIVRNYVEDHVALLVRPTMSREKWGYATRDLFEPGTAVLTAEGAVHLSALAGALQDRKYSGSEIVVAGFYSDEKNPLAPAVALELTRKQAEVVAEFLKEHGAHKLGTFSRRKVVALGMGVTPSPTDPPAASHVQVLLFVPR
jgi:phospholipid/cholesterol/gamma-HCH transport system substrate-binding protein